MESKISFFKAYRFRLLSGGLFVVFLVSTWFIFYQQPKYSEEIHVNLQEQLKEVIEDTLIKKNALHQNLEFQKMWTRSTNKRGQIRATFKYSFEDENQVNTSVKGWALINKKEGNVWSVDDIEVDHTRLQFQKPITLFSGEKKHPKPDPERPKENNPKEETPKNPPSENKTESL